MAEVTVMKECCGLCPFSRKSTLFVHPERAEEFAYSAENPYTDFVCHKTGITIDDHPDEDQQNDIVRGDRSLTCAGFHAMQHLINGTEDESEIELDITDHFSDAWEMIEHHTDEYESKNY